MILVTGATGLLGAHLVLHLAEGGLLVSGLYREEGAIEKTKALFKMHQKEHLFANVTWLLADITDIPALELAFQNIDYVYHCAAKISFDPRDEELLRKINIEGTANIVNLCLAKNVKKICFVSSIAALGDAPEHYYKERNTESLKIIDEETDWNPEKPHCDYAISKYGAEMELWRGQQEGLQIIIVNPGVILGPIPKSWNRTVGSYKLISKVAKGLKYYTHGTTGFVGIFDAVQCMTLLMNSPHHGSRYIVVSENLSYQNIATLIAEKMKVPPPKKEAKRWLTKIAWRWDWITANLFFKKREFTKAIAKSAHTNDFYSNQKIKNQLNFQFESMESIIEKIAKEH